MYIILRGFHENHGGGVRKLDNEPGHHRLEVSIRVQIFENQVEVTI